MKKGMTYEEAFGRERAEELKRIRREGTLRQHREGRYKSPPVCPFCGTWMSGGHLCEESRKKKSLAKLKNPVKYWLGKKRDEKTCQAISKAQREREHARGEESPTWEGGTRYWYQRDARKKMSKKIGRKLTFQEVVHHKDKDWKNNEDENLKLLTRSSHMKLHIEDGDIPIL